MDRLNRKLNSKANDLDDDESIEVKSEIILEKMNVTLPSTAHSSQSRRRNRQGTIDSLDSGIAMADKLEDFGLATVGNYKNNGGELQNASEMRNDEGDEESDDDAMVKSFPARPTPLPGRRNETNLEPLITTVSLKRTPPPPSSKNKTSWADTDEAKRLFYTDSKSNLGHSLDSPSQRNQVVKNPQKLQATNSFLAAVEPVKSHRGRNFAVELDDDDSD